MSGNQMQRTIVARALCYSAFAIVFSAVYQPALAQTATIDVYAEARASADKQAKEWLARGIPGLSLAVSVDGKLVYSESFGFADLEERAPVWPTTKFRIGSISKPLTAVALMKLVEAGKIDLDAPVQTYVPSFPDKGAPITVRMVAGHLAGIRHYKDDEFLIGKHYETMTAGLQIFQNDPLVSPPGTKFNYSTYGYDLLGAMIESVTGQSFPAYMQAQVFGPLGLVHTIADQNATIIEQRSRFYDKAKNGELENAPYVDNSFKWSGGGFLSTAEDLLRFGSAMLQPGFLRADSLKTMFTLQKTTSGEETRYGLGWFVRKPPAGELIYAHSGGSVGGTSQLIIYPESRLVIALVTNLSDADWKFDEVEAIAKRFVAATR
jgi:CubicO group peptidase (beta-lactamase class C family)